jgi:hypothetical protein
METASNETGAGSGPGGVVDEDPLDGVGAGLDPVTGAVTVWVTVAVASREALAGGVPWVRSPVVP